MKYIKNKIFVFLSISLIIFNSYLCKSLENEYSEDDDVIATITSDNESALRDALLILWKFGGTIYIDTPVINIKQQESLTIKGSILGSIIGIKQSNGEYPRLNFIEQRDISSLLYVPGITLTGSNILISYLIIENAGTTGIFIDGQKNMIDHVISRYNGQSGFYLSSKSDSNVLQNCYSYRNFHFIESIISEGFTLEVGGIDNIFTYCFAWENSENGFGNIYWDGKHRNGEIFYLHSASWNNGNINVFSGKYDFDNGKPLDKNLWTIQQIIKSDENFEKNYNNKKFNLNGATINSIPAKEYFTTYYYNHENEGNGFNFGNKRNEQNSLSRRTSDYCVAFDNKLKGFNNNDSENFTGIMTNCVGFNNNMNYELPYTFLKWNNNWGWGGKEEDKLDMDLGIKKPYNENSSKKNFYSIRDKIIKAVYANTFPENIDFEKTIKGLNE